MESYGRGGLEDSQGPRLNPVRQVNLPTFSLPTITRDDGPAPMVASTSKANDLASTPKNGRLPWLLKPESKCNLDPKTFEPVGPSFIATLIIILTFFALLHEAVLYFKMHSFFNAQQKAWILLAIGLECVAFYFYLLRYRRCTQSAGLLYVRKPDAGKDSVIGWLIFLLMTLVTGLLLRTFVWNEMDYEMVPRKARNEEEKKQEEDS